MLQEIPRWAEVGARPQGPGQGLGASDSVWSAPTMFCPGGLVEGWEEVSGRDGTVKVGRAVAEW